MLTKIKDILIGFIGGLVCVLSFILGKRLHNNGDRINTARKQLETDTDRLDEISGRMSDAQDRITDSLDILKKVRERKGQ